MKQGTMIKIEKETADMIKSHKITNHETYDEIIKRKLGEHKNA